MHLHIRCVFELAIERWQLSERVDEWRQCLSVNHCSVHPCTRTQVMWIRIFPECMRCPCKITVSHYLHHLQFTIIIILIIVVSHEMLSLDMTIYIYMCVCVCFIAAIAAVRVVLLFRMTTESLVSYEVRFRWTQIFSCTTNLCDFQVGSILDTSTNSICSLSSVSLDLFIIFRSTGQLVHFIWPCMQFVCNAKSKIITNWHRCWHKPYTYRSK